MFKKLMLILLFLFMIPLAFAQLESVSKDTIFTELELNKETGVSKFNISSPDSVNVTSSSLSIDFIEVCGYVDSYRLYRYEDCSYKQITPNYSYKEDCTLKNGSCDIIETYLGDTVEVIDKMCKVYLDKIPTGENTYEIEAEIVNEKCNDGSFGHKIDWVPTFKHENIDYVKSEWAWWNLSFSNCRDIEIKGAPSTYTDYTVYINVPDTSGMNDTGKGVVFIDQACNNDGIQLKHELENFETNDANYWVKIPSLTTANKTISMYYDSDIDTDFSDRLNVWNGDHVAVWHLSDVGDSTVYAHNMTNQGGTLSTAKIGNGYDLEAGSNEHLTFEDANDLSFTDGANNDYAQSLSFWVNAESLTNTGWVLSKFDAFGNDREWDTSIAADGSLSYLIADSSQNAYMLSTTATSTVTTSSWDHYTMTYDASESHTGMEIYKNGELLTTSRSTTGSYLGMENRAVRGIVGSRFNNDPATNFPFDGIVDEMRIYNVELDAAYVNYTYQLMGNQDTYVTVGTQQAQDNLPPEFNQTIVDSVIAHNTNFSYTGDFFDNETDEISITTNIGTASVNNISRTYSLFWNPDITEVGTNNFTISLDDGVNSPVSQSFSINVTNSAPEITINSITGVNGTAANVEASISEPENDIYNYTLTWYVNTAQKSQEIYENVTGAAAINTFLGAANFTVGDILNLSIYATDGPLNYFASIEKTVTVQTETGIDPDTGDTANAITNIQNTLEIFLMLVVSVLFYIIAYYTGVPALHIFAALCSIFFGFMIINISSPIGLVVIFFSGYRLIATWLEND